MRNLPRRCRVRSLCEPSRWRGGGVGCSGGGCTELGKRRTSDGWFGRGNPAKGLGGGDGEAFNFRWGGITMSNTVGLQPAGRVGGAGCLKVDGGLAGLGQRVANPLSILGESGLGFRSRSGVGVRV